MSKKISDVASEGESEGTDNDEQSTGDVQEAANADTADTEGPIDEAATNVETTPEPMKRDDLWNKIKALGPKVSRKRVRDFTDEEAAEAQTWVELTEQAIETGEERQPAPAFLVKKTDE